MLKNSLVSHKSPHIVSHCRKFFWLHPLSIVIICCALIIPCYQRVDWTLTFNLNWYEIFWLIPLPFALVSFLGLCLPHRRESNLAKYPLRELGTLYICLVTKGTNQKIVENSYWLMKSLESERVRLRVVSDRPLNVPHLLVPKSFQTKFAKYKARALEFFRLETQLKDNDWVLHLDEESVIDPQGIAACIDFCQRSPHLMGQGSILYNNRNFWRHPLIAIADCIRVGDDLARFYLQFAYLHKPIFGIHGSFLLVNGRIENEITWDLSDSLTEDYEFSVEYMRRGHTCGYVDGLVREQSPESIVDFLKQRRRWMVGIRSIAKHSGWARMWTLIWSFNPVILGVGFASTANLVGAGELTSFMVFIPITFITTVYLYLYLLGGLIQDLDRGSNFSRTLLHLIGTSIFYPLAFVLESAAVVWSYVSVSKHMGFQIVRKN